jgi:hypothetical protein
MIRTTVIYEAQMCGYVARMGKTRNAYRILAGKYVGRTTLRRPEHRWKDIRMDLKEVWWKGVDWIHLAQKRGQWTFIHTVTKFRVP